MKFHLTLCFLLFPLGASAQNNTVIVVPNNQPYMNTDHSGAENLGAALGTILGGAIGATARHLKESNEQSDVEAAMARLPGSGRPTEAQVNAMIQNPQTRQLGMNYYIQYLGQPGFPFPTKIQLQLLLAKPETHEFALALARRTVELTTSR